MVRKETEGRAAVEGGVRRSGRGGDDRARSPGKTELQSLHRNPREKAVGNSLFCLSLKAAMKGGGGNIKVQCRQGKKRESPVGWCEKGRQTISGGIREYGCCQMCLQKKS